MADTTLSVVIDLKDQFSKEVDKIKSKVNGLSQSFKTAGATLSAFGAAGVLVLQDWVKEANDAALQQNQLNAVLASTKNAAGLTAAEITKMASELQKVTTVGDDAIITGQNMLLSFTKIGKEVFPQVTETMVDMATAMNNGVTPSAEALASQAIQLGKALNNPTEGLTALTRVGVSFTKQQEDQIKTLQKQGDIVGAQKIILAELATEFGGRARAAADTFQGKMEQLNNRFSDIKENLGTALLPILAKFAGWIEKAIAAFEALDPKTQELIAKLALIATAIAVIGGPILLLLGFIPSIIAGVTAIAGAFGAVAAAAGAAFAFFLSPVGLVILAIAAIATAIYLIIKNWDWVKAKTAEVWAAIVAIFAPVAEFFQARWNEVMAATMMIWNGIKDFFTGIFEAIKFIIALNVGIIIGIFDFFGIDIVAIFQNIRDSIIAVWQYINDVLIPFIQAIWTSVSEGVSAFATKFVEAWGKVKAFFTAVWEGMKAAAKLGFDILLSLVRTFTDPIYNAFAMLWEAVGAKVVSAFDGVKEAIKGAINWVIDKINWFIQKANEIAAKGASAVGISIPSLPTLPRLAEGGIVRKPTIAMIGEAGPEAVVPLTKSATAGIGGGVTLNITVNGDVTGEDLIERVGKELTRLVQLSTATV